MDLLAKPKQSLVALVKPAPPSIPAPPPADDELTADTARAEVVDRLLHAWQGRLTYSLSPAALLLPFADWAIHLANAPGKQAALVEKAMRKLVRFGLYLTHSAVEKDTPPCIEPLPQDRRFASE